MLYFWPQFVGLSVGRITHTRVFNSECLGINMPKNLGPCTMIFKTQSGRRGHQVQTALLCSTL